MVYSQQGVAPNRNFAMTWCGTHMYSCTAEWITTQIIIYESTNIAEVHIGHRTICLTGWNGQHAIVGVKNAAGTAAVVAPGRDFPAVWAATDEAWRFTPIAGPSYTVAAIPYAPIPYAASAVYWYDSTSGAYLGTGPAIGVVPPVPTTYTAAVLGCSDTTKIYIHAFPPGIGGSGTVPHIDTSIGGWFYNNPSVCGVCNGSITLRGINPHQIDTVYYTFNGGIPNHFVDSAGIDSTITITGLCEGVYTDMYVKVGTCPSNLVGPATLVGPHLHVTADTFTNPTVCGKYDGTITLYGLFPSQPVSVSYIKSGTATPFTFTGVTLGDSSFTITGLGAGSYSSIVATIGLCSAPANPRTLVNPPAFPAHFTLTKKDHCNGDEVIVTNTSAPSGYHAYWDFGDGSVDSSGSIPLSHIYRDDTAAIPYTGTYTVKLTYSSDTVTPACASVITAPITFDHRIDAHYTSNANAVCLGTPITFNGTTISTHAPVFTWSFGDGSAIATSPTSLSATFPVPSFTTTIDYAYPMASFQPFVNKLTVTDSIGCMISATDTFEVILLDVHTTTHDTSVCLRLPMNLMALINPVPKYAAYSIAWTPTNNITGDTAGTVVSFMGIGRYVYTVTLTTPPLAINPGGCTASDTEAIVSYPAVTLTNVTESPQTVEFGSSVYLNANGGVLYTWTPDNGTLSNPNINNPIATPVDSITIYTVFAMNSFGCRDSAFVTVNLDYSTIMDGMPSGFTPNGDGKNDVFKITKLKYQKLVDFRIFNRWGQEVFHTANPDNGWDGNFNGTPQDIGVYTYVIIVAYPEGGNKTYKGTVTLLR